MTNFNFLSKSGSQSMGLSSVTLALTVGSPSAHRRSTMLRLLYVLVLVLTFGVGNVWGADYTYDFSKTTGWYTTSAKTSNVTTGTDYTSIYDSNGVLWSISSSPYRARFNSGYFMLGKSGKYITLPTYSGEKITSIDIQATNGHSTAVSVNIYTSTGAAASTDQTWSTTGKKHEYSIKSDCQSATLRIQVTNANSTQFTSVIIHTESTSTCTQPTTALSLGATSTSITTEGSTTLSPNGGNGSTITYTVTSANASSATINGTTFSASATGTYTVQASQDDSEGTCGGTATVNITVTNPTRTVNWVVNNEAWTSGVVAGNSSVTSGSKISVMPTAPTSSNCDNTKVFVGWTATENYSNASTPPTDLFTAVSASPAINTNKTFYAVFATNATKATRVTSTSGVTSGDRIAICNDKNSYIMLSTFATEIDQPEENENNEIAISNANQQWLLHGDNTNGFTLTNGTITLGVSSASSGSSVSNTTTRSLWKFGSTNVNANCLSLTNTNPTYRLEYSGGWVYYNSTNAGWTSLKIYKVNYTNYATTCCQPLGSINGSFSLTHF